MAILQTIFTSLRKCPNNTKYGLNTSSLDNVFGVRGALAKPP